MFIETLAIICYADYCAVKLIPMDSLVLSDWQIHDINSLRVEVVPIRINLRKPLDGKGERRKWKVRV